MNVPPPPLLVSFNSVENFLDALPDDVATLSKQEILQLVESGLPPLISIVAASTLFGVSKSFIGSISQQPNKYYRQFKIRKGRKQRLIQAPKVALKIIQRWFGYHVARSTPLPDYVFGFVPGKNGVIEAAKLHCGAHWVYSLDLRDFFPSIVGHQVTSALQTRGYSERAANFISRLCTLDNRLPQGSPASPVLSNLVFQSTDNALNDIAEQLGVRYSRYADDLVFSGIDSPPEILPAQVKETLMQFGWTIASEKEHLAKVPARLKVHGLLVHGDRPRLTKGYRNRIRAYRHLLDSDRITPEDIASIRGHLAYADLVDHVAQT